MVDTIKASVLPIKATPATSDSIVIIDSADSLNTKQSTLESLSSGLDKSEFISTDSDNLLSIGSDSKISSIASDMISTDVGNIAIVGTDNKVYAPAVALSITEDTMLIGGTSDVPEENTSSEVRTFLGLPEDYIKDTIEYVNSTQITWEGKCRDSSNTVDLEITSAVTATLSSAAADTTYHMFVGKLLPTSSEVVVFSTSLTLAGYTYYRRVLSIKTNSTGNIVNFNITKSGVSGIRVNYLTPISDYTDVTIGNFFIPVSAPSNTTGYFRLVGNTGVGSGDTLAFGVNAKYNSSDDGDILLAGDASRYSRVYKSIDIVDDVIQVTVSFSSINRSLFVQILNYTDERVL